MPRETSDGSPPDAWLLIVGDVPERWRHRAVPGSVVHLLPGEVAELMEPRAHPNGEGSAAEKALTPDDAELLRLVAAGMTGDAIARVLHVSHRTVQRRLEKLRRTLGVTSRAELLAYAPPVGRNNHDSP